MLQWQDAGRARQQPAVDPLAPPAARGSHVRWPARAAAAADASAAPAGRDSGCGAGARRRAARHSHRRVCCLP
jgi:hypothetical protein